MRKTVILTLIIFVLLILDNTIMPLIGIQGYYPNLLFTFVVIYSMLSGPVDAMVLGSFSGILQDIYFVNCMGINAFANLIICVLAAQFGKSIFKEKAMIPVLSVFVFSTLKNLIVYIILILIGESARLGAIIFPGIYNIVFAMIMYKSIYRLSEKSYMKREWKF